MTELKPFCKEEGSKNFSHPLLVIAMDGLMAAIATTKQLLSLGENYFFLSFFLK